jgi:hypothetical protein
VAAVTFSDVSKIFPDGTKACGGLERKERPLKLEGALDATLDI